MKRHQGKEEVRIVHLYRHPDPGMDDDVLVGQAFERAALACSEPVVLGPVAVRDARGEEPAGEQGGGAEQ